MKLQPVFLPNLSLITSCWYIHQTPRHPLYQNLVFAAHGKNVNGIHRQHLKTLSILVLTSLRKEGKGLNDVIAKLESDGMTVAKHTLEINQLKLDFKWLKEKYPSLQFLSLVAVDKTCISELTGEVRMELG